MVLQYYKIKKVLKEYGHKEHWIVTDIPSKNIIFVKSRESIIKDHTQENVLLERDPVKISDEFGNVRLLAEVESSIISRLETTFNYIPNVFCSEPTLDLLVKHGVIGNFYKNS